MKYKPYFYYLFCCIIYISINIGLGIAQESSSSKKSVPSDSVQTNFLDVIKESPWSSAIVKVFWIVLIFLFAFIIIKFISQYLENLSKKSPKIRSTINRILPIFQVFFWLILFYLIITEVVMLSKNYFMIAIVSVIIAVLMATQDVLRNIFNGLYNKFDSLLLVGEVARIGEYYGEIVKINLTNIKLKTANQDIITINNNDLIRTKITKEISGTSKSQVSVNFYLPMNANLQKVKKIANQAAAVSRYVYLDKPIAVSFSNEIFNGNSMLKVQICVYLLDITHKIKFTSEITEVVISQLLDQQIINHNSSL